MLFKIYFKLNTLQLCSKLINVVERPGVQCATDAYWLFPVSDVVTYKYYVGRLKMFEDRYEDARDCFLFALRHTPRVLSRDVQRILINLLPVQVRAPVNGCAAISCRFIMNRSRLTALYMHMFPAQMCLGVMPGPGVGSISTSDSSSSGGLLGHLRSLGQAVVAGDIRRFEEVRVEACL